MEKRRRPTSLGLGKSFNVRLKINGIKSRLDANKAGRKGNRVLLTENRRYKTMRIVFKESFTSKTNPNASGKTYSIVRVKGTAMEGKMKDQEWTTQFFANNKDLYDQVKTFSNGDIVDVSMTKNGNFWNPTGFTKVTGDAAPTVNIPQSNPQVNKDSKAPTPEDTAKVLEDYQRTIQIKFAINAMGPIGKKNVVKYMKQAGEIADLIGNYMDKSGMFQFDKETSENGIPDIDDANDSDDNVDEMPDDDLI